MSCGWTRTRHCRWSDAPCSASCWRAARYGMDDHPFSLSSSAVRPPRPALTVKALGDFSASLAQLPPGTEVLVDGPHGEAAHDHAAVRGRLLVAAGSGEEILRHHVSADLTGDTTSK